MQPHSGSDSYGQGLSYPDNSGPFYIAPFLALNNTNGTSPVYLGTNVFRPNESLIKSLNRTDYYQIIQPLWDQFDFYLHIPSIYEWFSNSDNPTSSGQGDHRRRLETGFRGRGNSYNEAVCGE